LLEVSRFVLALASALLLVACANSQDTKPELPSSVSPGWSLKSFNKAPGTGSPVCWNADYEGSGSAAVSVCRYATDAGAFDAVQRARAEAQTVKFQVGVNEVLVHWNNAPKTNLEALIRTIQKALKTQ